MYKITLIAVFYCFLFSDISGGNQSVFRLTDNAFTVGSIYRTSRPLLFDIDNHSKLSDQSKPLLDSLVDFLLRHPGTILEICAHTDQRGSDSLNVRVSQHRAQAVKDYLISRGITDWHLAAVGYGETQPLIPETDIKKESTANRREELYSENRRIEFRLLNDPDTLFTLADSTFRAGTVYMPGIRFELAKATIRTESFAILDSLADFLINHPELHVEVAGHTDGRVNEASSVRLSKSRANSVMSYLINKGVSAQQIVAQGYEGRNPMVTMKSIERVPGKEGREELHRLNRRTEIRISSVSQQ